MSIAIKRNFTIPSTSSIGASEISLSSSTASTSVATGAIVSLGGAGISGAISLGGPLKLYNGSYYTGFDSAATGNTTYIWPATSPATGTSVLSSDAAGNLSWVLMSASGSGLTLNGLTATTQYFSTSISGVGFSVSSIGSTHIFYIGLAGNATTGLISSTSQTLFGLKSFASGIAITSGTASTSTSTGDLVVTGGVGIGASLNIAGNTSVTSSTASTSTSTGALIVTGGVGVGSSVNIAGNTNITSSNASTSTTTGALIVSGGAGIGGSVNVGGTLRLGSNTFTKSGFAIGDLLLDNGGTDTPAILFYWGNNKNIGIDTYYPGTGTTRIRIVKELNESGGSELWSVDRNGIVTRSAWDVGEVIASRMYNYSDLNMSATTTVGVNTYVRIANITYTPKSSSSYIWIEFSCVYEIAGAAADDFYSNITVNGTEIVYNRQIWINGSGGGTRSGALFPISARYTNSSTSGIAITVQAARGSSDDNGTFVGNSVSGYMRIMEIGR